MVLYVKRVARDHSSVSGFFFPLQIPAAVATRTVPTHVPLTALRAYAFAGECFL